MNKLQITPIGDTQILITRQFAASPEAVFKAHTEPHLIQKWALGPEGWTMPVCIFEAKPGGRMRYEWSHPDGQAFYLTGEIVEICPFSKIRHVERWHIPDPSPDNHVETSFEANEGGTLLTLKMNLPSKEARDATIASGMEHGMEASYANLEKMN